MDDAILGIDLGTTNSLVGLVDSGFPILLADENGQRLVPSAVYFPEDGSEPVVGEAALRMRSIAPGRVVTSIKRLIGRRADELAGGSAFEIVAGEGGAAAVRVGGEVDFCGAGLRIDSHPPEIGGREGDGDGDQPGGDHRASLLQRRAAECNQAGWRAGRAGGRAHRQ